jgi:alpha-beta hydrolase superfamily lysophospholipase
VVVGSSYGGITALCAAIRVVEAGGTVAGLVLCAPALGRAEPPATEMELYPPVSTTIIHGSRDQVVPVELSRAFAAAHPEVDLIEVDDEHRLADSLDRIVDATRRAIQRAGGSAGR